MRPEGERGEKRSVAAMNAPRTQATVVKKPKTFWMRVKELCMVGGLAPRLTGAAACLGKGIGSVGEYSRATDERGCRNEELVMRGVAGVV